MRAPLYLSKRKAKKCVCVPVKITEHLHSHHIDIIRFIYRCFVKKTNVVLNIDNATNKPLQICAFMSAVRPFPALLILPDDEIDFWHQEIKSKTQFTVTVVEDPTENVLAREEVTLVPHKNLKRMHNLKNARWSLFLIDAIEEVIKIACIKKILAKFYIGITKYDFIRNPNYQLLKEVLKWAKHNEKISLKHLLLNQEFWLKLYKGNCDDAEDDVIDDNKTSPVRDDVVEQKNVKTFVDDIPESPPNDSYISSTTHLNNNDRESSEPVEIMKKIPQRRKFVFDDKPYKKEKNKKQQNGKNKGVNEMSLANLTSINNYEKFEISFSSGTDRMLAEVADENSQIFNLNLPEKSHLETAIENISEKNKSFLNTSLEEMKPDPILDALFFNDIKNIEDEPNETFLTEKSPIVDEMCGNTETEKLLDKLFLGIN